MNVLTPEPQATTPPTDIAPASPPTTILMVSWEFPPKIVGGISRHVYDLSVALASQGHDVHVVTCEHPGAPAEEDVEGVHVYRVTPEGPTNDFIHWVQRLNDAMFIRADRILTEILGDPAEVKAAEPALVGAETAVKPAAALPAATKASATTPAEPEPVHPSRDPKRPILIHAHDWLAHFCANGLKHKHRIPMVATIHATEYGRNNGINGPTQTYIASVEWELQKEAWRVIVCTEFMKREVEHALKTPWDKMDIIYNGVDAQKFEIDATPEELAAFRAQYAAPEEKIIFFVGRMVREKGVQVLIEALPKIRWGYHDAKLLICGGGYREHLVSLAHYVAMERHVYFAGFVPDADLLKIYKIVDIACFPSLYEPFGIVALEGMAAKVPVVVSDAGGLPEVVQNGVTGTTTYAGNPNSLADGILSVLHQPEKARQMADEAYERVLAVFNWQRIAKQTVETYERVWTEHVANPW
jgi:glycogen(starch) synthase